jgi:hypothetical protein
MKYMHASTIEKAPRILELYDQGVAMEDIEAETRTSRKTIRLIASRHGRAKRLGGRPRSAKNCLRIPMLREDHLDWLSGEAARLKITRGEMMRAIIIDAIEEEKARA